ncbi:MAG: 2-oxoglutarate dehydrogenase, E2 component, dihydrolipoamide succinyltransferase [Jiangellaceae bacterium]
MTTSVTLPALGESVTEGTVTRWLKQPGEQVQADEPLLEVSTDKVDTEIPAPASGTLLEIKVAEDETVEVGTELAVIGEPSEGDGAAPQQDTEAAEQAPTEQAEQAPAEQAEQAPPAEQAEQAPPAEQDEQAAPTATAPTVGTSVTLPALGESVTEGTVTRWLKQVGDQVQTDEPLLEISTDKVDTEIPSPASGTLLEIKVAEDETVEVGTELAIIGSADGAAQEAPAAQPADTAPATALEDAAAKAETPLAAEAATQAAADAQSEAKAKEDTPSAPPPAAAPPAPPAPPAPGTGGDGSPYVTPLVRKLAAEHSVDLATLSGTGVGGRIRKQDVLAAAEQARKAAETAAAAPAAPAAPAAAAAPAPAATPSPLRGTTEKMSRMRTVIAKRMVESLQTSAQLTTVVEVDVTAIARLRQKAKAAFEGREGVKLSFLPFFAKAAVEALKAHPKLNATVDMEKNEVTYFEAEHLGVAVDTERGLLVPVIHGAGDLNIAGLARRIADLAERTRANKISPDELSGGTFTLTNTGSRGALFDTPIINQPQVAILGTGAVVKRPTVVTDDIGADSIGIRSMVYFALTYDHRLVDGADAARYLTTVKQRLERGQFEGDLGI